VEVSLGEGPAVKIGLEGIGERVGRYTEVGYQCDVQATGAAVVDVEEPNVSALMLL
jgi:hypothetical protein